MNTKALDFLGKEIKVGDTIIWAVHRKYSKSEIEQRRGIVREVYEVETDGYTKIQIKVDVDLSAPNLKYIDYKWASKQQRKTIVLSTYKNLKGKDSIFPAVYVL